MVTNGGAGDPEPGPGADARSSPASTYAEFRVRIEPGPRKRQYRVVASGPGGQVEGAFRLPFSDLELENFVLKVGGTRKGVRSLDSPEMDLAKTFGAKLFDAVFEGDVRGLYRASTVEASNAGQGLRITLALSDSPELLRVPWEYLYDRPLFPSTDRRTPIVRYLDLPKPIKPLKVELPLQILAIVSAPTDVPAIDGVQERAKLEAALAPLTEAGNVHIDWLEDANLSSLYKLLSSKDRPKYHILHFIGHGGFVKEADEGVLLFEGKDGRHQGETGDKLGTILQTEGSLRLAVLNSCEGARASIKDPFSSVATSLIEHEIPAVIGMQFEITDRAAILFSSEFYAALADGRAVDESLSQARMAIFADDNDIEWGTPVLFMRVADGRLFDVVDGPAKAPAAPATEPDKEDAAEAATMVAATAAAEAEQRDLEAADRARREAEAAAATADASTVALPDIVPPAGPAVQPRPGWRELVSRRGVRLAVATAAILGALGLLGVVLLVATQGPRTTISIAAAANGAPGAIEVTGTGFEAGEVIALTADGTFVGSTTAKDDGTFTAPVVAPPGAGSRYDVVARGSSSGRSARGTYALAAVESASLEPTGSIAPPLPAPGIVFYSNVEPGSDQTDHEIYVVDPLTGKIRGPLTNDQERDTSPVWSPDGSRIAWVRGPKGSRDIYVMDADGTHQGALVGGPTDDYFPAWLRDGSILFVREVNDHRTIWRWREGAAPESVVALPDKLLMSPTGWSTDGTQLAMWGVGPESKDNDLYILRMDGTLTRMTSGTFDDRNPAWAPGGRTLAFVRSGGVGPADSDLWLLEVKSKKVTTQLTDTDFNDGAPTWAPNGRRIAFCRQTPDGFEIRVINSDGTGEDGLMKGRGGLNLDPNWR